MTEKEFERALRVQRGIYTDEEESMKRASRGMKHLNSNVLSGL